MTRSVGVVGGGTAGYLTALALQKWRPELSVTLIESSAIPILGVGEATTPPLLPFLHNFLELDVNHFVREVRATWKIGIHFEWGQLPFNYPFTLGLLGDAYMHDGDISRASLSSMLMDAHKMPLRRADGGFESMLPKLEFAYHLDNEPFVRYLQARARERGIQHIDTTIAHVRTAEGPDGEPVVRALTGAAGQELSFDFYVDCTGFRSLLLGDALGSPFVSFDSSLFCDRAVVAEVPHGGHIKPYTLAETMDAGWCWGIPQVHEDHRGYVYSSAFLSDEAAVDEMRRCNPEMGEPWFVKFRSGRRQHFWRGNVAAVGNAYGFVEPLESTAIHLIVAHIHRVMSLLDERRSGTRYHDRALVNQTVAGHWDHLRWFLALHYRFNRNRDTPFWRACRAQTDVSGVAEHVDDYRTRGPLSSRGKVRAPDSLFGPGAIDVMLLGQHVPTVDCATTLSPERWDARCAWMEQFCADALPQAEALDVLNAHPQLLHELVHDEASWCHQLASTPPLPEDES